MRVGNSLPKVARAVFLPDNWPFYLDSFIIFIIGLVKTALIHLDYAFPMNLIVPVVDFFIGESPDKAAETPVWLALSNEVKAINGEYIHHKKIKKSWAPTMDEKAQSKLYNVTLSMLDKWL